MRIDAKHINQKMKRKDLLSSRISTFPVLEGLKQFAAKEIGKKISKEMLTTSLKNIVTGKVNLEESFLDLTKTASKVIDRIIPEEERLANKTLDTHVQFRNAIIRRITEKQPRKSRKGRKDEYLLQGQALHPETEEPVKGLVVKATEKGADKFGLTAVDVTDEEGKFEIVFDAQSLKNLKKTAPRIQLQVGPDIRRLPHIPKETFQVKPGTRDELTIVLPTETVKTLPASLKFEKQLNMNRIYELHQMQSYESIQHFQIQEVTKVFKDGLNEAIAFLEKRTKQSTPKAAGKKEK